MVGARSSGPHDTARTAMPATHPACRPIDALSSFDPLVGALGLEPRTR
jgi:hypothetical protein